MANEFSIESNIMEVIQAARMDASVKAQLGNIIAETYNRWSFRLIGSRVQAPGKGLWPVGRLVNPGTRKEWYAKPRKDGSYNPRAQQSGRSLGGWRKIQKGLNLSAINDTVDGRRRFYVPFVHKKNEPSGAAVKQAAEVWAEEFYRSKPEMENVIVRGMNRGQ